MVYSSLASSKRLTCRQVRKMLSTFEPENDHQMFEIERAGGQLTLSRLVVLIGIILELISRLLSMAKCCSLDSKV